MNSANQNPQHGYLDRLVAQAQRFLLRWRLQRELRQAATTALTWLFVFPLLLLLVRVVTGASTPVNLWMVAALALLGPVLYVLWRVARQYLQYRPGRRTGLALFDSQLDSKDRLVTADEFMDEGADDRSAGSSHAFKQAAVDDAGQYVNRALQTSLDALPMPEWRVRPLSWLGVPAALVVIALLIWGIGGSGAVLQDTDEERLASAVEADAVPDTAGPQRLAMRRDPRRTQEPQPDPLLTTERPQEQAKPSPQRSRNEEAAEGQSNAGSAAMAQSSSNSSSAAGQPSSQKNASKPGEQEASPEEKKKKDSAAKKRAKPPQQNAQMTMEATTGQGKSGGSSSSVAEFEVPQQPDQLGAGLKEDEQAEETEDEDEEEKSSGVTKPGLRDRKAPVDRNASPSPTGKESRDDLNGRGGPGSRKKTRGVPSMILGIPIADRVQGKPSPGRSKVTQENAKPTAESHPSAAAQERMARNEPAGHLEQQRLLPWMQALIRDYFMSVHEQAAAARGADAGPDAGPDEGAGGSR